MAGLLRDEGNSDPCDSRFVDRRSATESRPTFVDRRSATESRPTFVDRRSATESRPTLVDRRAATVAPGQVPGSQLSHFLGESLRRFRDAGKPLLGICNGFQGLWKAGMIGPPDDDGPLATLAHNTSGKFEDRWIYLRATPGRCPFLK